MSYLKHGSNGDETRKWSNILLDIRCLKFGSLADVEVLGMTGVVSHVHDCSVIL